ncbi:unnamed protein product [Triticum turgidum subsp. durum]|uniref:Epoxide hydrolase n=3 Tax=Triticum TaxID=4564 RepID=A0A9R1P7L1_TRITD|nr:unnamed protein product [Triticum turgidum subsp. durum]
MASRRYGTRGATRCRPWPPQGTAPSRRTAAGTACRTSRRSTRSPSGRTSSPTCSPSSMPSPSPRAYFQQRWRQPGQAEADFGRYNIRCVVRTIYVLFSGREIPAAEQGQEAMDLADGSAPLPEWFTEEDLDVYAALYENSGFGYPIKMPYGSLDKMATQLEARFEVPVLMVMGEDYVMKLPGFEAAVRGGMMAGFAPDLKVAFVPEGRHFVQEQFPTQVNELLLGFLKDHP